MIKKFSGSMLLALIAMLCATSVPRAGAQAAERQQHDEVEITVAIVEHLIELYPQLAGGDVIAGRQNVVLDPYIFRFADNSRPQPESHSASRMAAATERTAVRSGRMQEMSSCSESSPSSCRLAGETQLVIRLGEMSSDGEEAEVPVLVVYRLEQDKRQPVHSATLQFSLLKNAEGRWEVREAEVTGIT